METHMLVVVVMSVCRSGAHVGSGETALLLLAARDVFGWLGFAYYFRVCRPLNDS